MSKRIAALLVLAWMILASVWPAASSFALAAGSAPALEPYTDSKWGFSLLVPKGWKVQAEKNIIGVSSPSGHANVLIGTASVAPSVTAVGFMRGLLEFMVKQHVTDVHLLRVLVSPRYDLVMIDMGYRGTSSGKIGLPKRATMLAAVQGGGAFFTVCEAYADEFSSVRSTLERVAASFQLPGQSAAPAASAQAQSALEGARCAQAANSDGSSFVAAPAGWTVTGSDAIVIAAAPGDRWGVFYQGGQFALPETGYGSMGMPECQYLSPVDFVTRWFIPKASGVRSQVRVDKVADDREIAAQFQQAGIQAECQEMVVSYLNDQGRSETAYLRVACVPPNGLGTWSMGVGGFWAPTISFETDFAPLFDIANTIHVNPEWQQAALAQQSEGLARNRQISQTLSETSDIVSRMLANKRAGDNRMIQQQSNYAGGEVWGYSQSENKVYALPETYQSYRTNPNNPTEVLQEVPPDRWEGLPDRSAMPGGN